jgi:NAD(P)-dependent dehydrogenase (short-subunit alcohol dehydrogenase family)
MAKGGRIVKTAVITGGAGGLGRALAAGLQAEGWFTALIDLPGRELAAVKGSDQQQPYACDLTDAAQLAQTCAAIRGCRPSIDLVVYNAGITQIGYFAQSDLATQRRVFEINYFAAVAMALEFLPDIRAAKGTHLAISSVAGFAPLYRRTAYAASKHALEGFFKSLRGEEAAYGVTTLIAAPSFIATNPGNPEAKPDGTARPGSATDGLDYMLASAAAAIILQGLARQQPMIPVGRVARAAWWLNGLAPKIYERLMVRNLTR